MKLEFKGKNHRGREIWIDTDYYDESKPYTGFELEEWQIPRYQEMMNAAVKCMGRKLTREEARTLDWLSGMEPETCQHITRFIREAYENPKKAETK
ncbi:MULTISPECIES: hypothetical protein [Paenibacillus]|uniref:Phage protein n=1 Tax=Paenibacillus odorifer TaxID=189426 RepID=A0AB36J2R7_9BACL|nr:hypothetical protein [Paenibacillus odorifer]OMD10602.1 hypothetical protein BJP50_28215 [Paenibacillus odorifer]OME07449.1 hypothetical protein BSK60_31495 [Paenibacillus odorifer]OME10262.1 hypothetical protein BSK47_31065 [Paenibacillus odorifer]